MTVHADGEFSPVQELFAEMSSRTMVTLTSANDHVPKIEQKVQVVKERCRATSHSLPFLRLPVILTINTLLNNVSILVYLPTTAGISKKISAKEIMTGEALNYKRHLAILFGQYC